MNRNIQLRRFSAGFLLSASLWAFSQTSAPSALLNTGAPETATPSTIGNQTNRELTQWAARFYISQNDIGKAVKVLKRQVDSDPQDAGTWNLMGLIMMRLGKFSEAQKFFLQAVKVARQEKLDIGLYLYNAASAAHMAKDLEASGGFLQEAQNYPSVSDTAKLALRTRREGIPLPALPGSEVIKGPWTYGATVSLGWDSNPGYVSSILAEQGVQNKESSGYLQLDLTANYTKPNFLRGFQGQLYSSMLYYMDKNLPNLNSDAVGLYLASGNLKGNEPGFTWGIDNATSATFFDLTQWNFGYWQNNFEPVLNWGFGRSILKLKIPVPFRNVKLADGTSPDDDLSGYGVGPHVGYIYDGDNFNFETDVSFDLFDARGRNYDQKIYGLYLAFENQMTTLWSAGFSFQYFRQNYYHSLNARLDNQYEPQLHVNYDFTKSARLGLHYDFIHNDSTQEGKEYERHEVSLAYSLIFY